jgi:polysaccharide export outer membrane protein
MKILPGVGWLGLLAIVQPLPVLAQVAPTLPGFPEAATPAAVGQRAAVEQNYTLGAGDLVKLDLFDVPAYSGEYQVLSDGTLSLPRIGTVAVRGMTLDQAAAEISARYARYVRRPFATLSLLEAGALNVAIAGEVNRPGTYVVSPEEIAGVPTVTQVIQLAGGITQAANIREIQVRRFAPNGNQTLQVNLWDLLRSGDINQDLVLQDRDTIVIPAATALNPGETTALASASFSPDTMTVNVVGEVVQPGAIVVPPNTPLNQAVLAAGGFNTRARRSEVTLVRLNPNGSVERQEIEVDLAQGVDLESNPALRNNDTIVVGRSGLTSVTDTLGTILSPLTSLFRLLGL